MFKNLFKNIDKNRVIIISLLFAVFLSYGRLPFQFYQQDEWHHFGVEFLWHSLNFSDFVTEKLLAPYGVRFLPFAQLANYLQFSVLGQASAGYGLVSFLLHLTNAILVYFATLKLIESRRIAFLTAIFFGTTPVSQQAATWLIQHTGTLPALTFSLLSIIAFCVYLEKTKMKYLLFTIIFTFLAIGFKEISLFTFPFLFLISLLKRKTKSFSSMNPHALVAIFSMGLIHLVFTGVLFLSQPRQATAVFIPKAGLVQTMSRRAVSIPLRSVTQSFMSEKLLTLLTESVVKLPLVVGKGLQKGTPAYAIYLEQVVTKRLMYLIAVGLLVVLGYVLKKNKKQAEIQKIIAFGLAFILFGSLPLFFISTLAGDFVFLESRYLYVIAIGSSLLAAGVFNYLIGRFAGFGWFIVGVFLISNIYQVNQILDPQIKLGQVRRDILSDIRGRRPNLPEKVVFYTESDRSYYGLPANEKIMPFQSGFGQTLMVWYQETANFPLEFYEEDFLWEIGEQGYREFNGRGFGYFRDIDLLKKTLVSYKLAPDSIIAFRYNAYTHNLVDITDEIREKVNEGKKK